MFNCLGPLPAPVNGYLCSPLPFATGLVALRLAVPMGAVLIAAR